MDTKQSPGLAVEYGTAPFRYWIIDDWCQPIDMNDLPLSDSAEWEARYDNDTERLKRTTRSLAAIPGTAELFDRMRAATEEWSIRLGYPVQDDSTLHGAGIHVTESGGWLSTHLDYSRHPKLPHLRRAINLIAFVNPVWEESWGGALCLCDPMGNVVQRIYPKPGRLAAFEVGDLSYHGVEPLNGPVERVSLAVYFLNEATVADTRCRALFVPNRGM